MANLVGTNIGNIRIEAMLGRGGMGEVYRGFDMRLERRVAVKTIRADQSLDPDMKARFLREARILSRIEHPAICQVYDLVEGGDTDYLIFEYVEGETLERRAASRRLTESEILELGEKIAQGLAAAHRERIVHRDLKPGNVMVTPTGAVKILDFGISRAVKEKGAAGEAREDRDRGSARPHANPAVGGGTPNDPYPSVDSGAWSFADDPAERGPGLAPAAVAGRSIPGAHEGTIVIAAGGLAAAVEPVLPAGSRGGTADLDATGVVAPPVAPRAPTPDDATIRLASPAAAAFASDSMTLDADLTQYGYLIGTVRYMSPEQASGRDISEASDLYALGILLQELLTGEPAYRQGNNSNLLLDVAQARTLPIRGVDPEVAQLVSDLENPDPSLRPAAEATAKALRFILDRPLRQRRQRLQRLVAAGVAVAMTVVAIVVSVLAVRASREAARANREAARAAAEATRAREVANFLLELFTDASPDNADGEELTVRALVDRGSQRLDSELSAQPILRASLQDTLAGVYYRLGRLEEADRLARAALEVRTKELSADDPDVAKSRHQLAAIEAERGQIEAAEVLLGQSIASLERAGASETETLASAVNDLAALRFELGRYEEAVTLYRRALTLYEALPDADWRQVSGTLSNLAVLAWQMGNYAESEELYLRSLAMTERATDSEHTSLIPILNNLGILYREQGKLEQAAPLHERALAIAEKRFGEEHPEVAQVLYSIGRLELVRGSLGAAQKAFERALLIFTASRGAGHYEAARCQVQLAEIARRNGRFGLGEELLAAALPALEASLGAEHPATLDALEIAAHLAADDGRDEDARAHYTRAAAIAANLFGADAKRAQELAAKARGE